MKNVALKGIIPPIVTPMNDDAEQSVNLEVLRQQVERLLADFPDLATPAS